MDVGGGGKTFFIFQKGRKKRRRRRRKEEEKREKAKSVNPSLHKQSRGEEERKRVEDSEVCFLSCCPCFLCHQNTMMDDASQDQLSYCFLYNTHHSPTHSHINY